MEFLRSGLFHFVHVSSCFPRKGVDVLVRAFCEEFRKADDVCLIIKTFPNPHNLVEELVREAGQRSPGHASVRIVTESMTNGQMRYLLENANCLVSASRGEGFGLPVAEAMLVGCPVIATVHGGQADLCAPESCWPVEFQIVPAKTHLTEGPSVWAEPSVSSLRERMREVYRATREEVAARTLVARAHIAENFTWAQVARRHLAACEQVRVEKGKESRPRPSPESGHIGFISTWNTKGGIAEYTRYLAECLHDGTQYSVFADRVPGTVRPDKDNVFRCWVQSQDARSPQAAVSDLLRRIKERRIDVVSLQYNFGFLSPAVVEHLVERLHAEGIG